MSDLHIDVWGTYKGYAWFQQEFLPSTQTDADVLILAGDIVNLSQRNFKWSVARLQEFGHAYKNVVFIPGNHEFYGTTIPAGLKRLYDIEPMVPGLHVLGPDRPKVIDGQRFLGGTLFQPRIPFDDIGRHQEISDHDSIGNFSPDASEYYRRMEKFLTEELCSTDVLVTHHPFSNKSLSDEWKGHPANYFFITPQIEPLILDRQPRLAFHGHVHQPYDYMLGNTRVLCSPIGYPGEDVKFNPQLVVEI